MSEESRAVATAGVSRRTIIHNGSLSVIQQLVTTGTSAAITFALVFALPVEDYGRYSYAVALVAIGMSVTNAGLTGHAVKVLLAKPAAAGATILSVLLIRESFAAVAYVALLVVSLTGGSFVATMATAVAGLTLLARAADVPEFWYRAKMRNGTVAVVRIVAALLFFSFRLIAIWQWSSLWIFLALFVLESLFVSVVLVISYLRDKQSPKFARGERGGARDLLKGSYPLALSGIANEINLRSDVIVIQALLGSSAVAVYSVAARLSELAYVLPVVVMNVTLPVLLQARSDLGPNDPAYLARLQRSYTTAFWAGVGTSIAVGAVGAVAFNAFLGDEFAESVGVLWISLIACPFIFMSAVYSKWIVAEGLYWASLTRHSFGALLNVVMNLALIPAFGIMGSAYATVISYVAASYLACFLGRSSRQAGVQMTRAIIAPVLVLFHRQRRHV